MINDDGKFEETGSILLHLTTFISNYFRNHPKHRQVAAGSTSPSRQYSAAAAVPAAEDQQRHQQARCEVEDFGISATLEQQQEVPAADVT